jgi:hypothetical protein
MGKTDELRSFNIPTDPSAAGLEIAPLFGELFTKSSIFALFLNILLRNPIPD